MDRSTPEVISNSRALIDAMGHWPGFHDARLLAAVRAEGHVRVVVHVFEMTDEVDASGYFVLTKHHLVRIEMLRLISCTMPEGYDGDILDGITATRSAAGIVVQFDSVVDPARAWQAVCREARISDVTPCDGRGRAL